MTDLNELASRVEALTGPCRETDARIWCAINGKRYKAWFDVYGANSGRLTQVEFTEPPRRTRRVTDGRQFKHAEPYTGSIDAAMTLVPADSWHEIKGPRKYLNIPSQAPNYWSAHLARWNHEGHAMGWGATPALALTAASLRARAAMGEG